jgi:hypothetical protein
VSDARVHEPPVQDEAARRWRHNVRNELNVITMAVSAARSLIDHGYSVQRAREHLVRAEAACARCHELVKDWPERN